MGDTKFTAQFDILVNSAIVMDNAIYQNNKDDNRPTSANLKDIRNWLLRHNVEIDDRMTKAQF